MTAPVRRPLRRAAPRGFTLVEVLVSLAIVAIALGAGLRATTAITDNAERLADVMAAQWCAENELTRLVLQRRFPGTGETEFGCQQLGREFRGRLIARPSYNPNFQIVDAAIADAEGRPLLRLSTVVGRN